MRKRRNSIYFAVFVSLLGTMLIPFQLATADQSLTYLNANYAGTAYLNASKSLSVDITPLNNGSDTWRYLNWSWNDALGLRAGGGQIGIDVYSNGSQHNFVMSIDNATDEQLLTGVGNPVTCDKRNPYEVNGKTYFQAVCWTPYTLAPGHTFRLQIFNNANLGPTWFNASFEDLTTGAKLQIGSINSGDKNLLLPLRYVQYGMGDLGTNNNCSAVGINDTIVSNITNSGLSISTISSQSMGSCLNAVIVPNKYSLGGNVFKFGGANPGSRNLEANASTNASTNSSQTLTRTPRAIASVPVPAGFSTGLYQLTYVGYFNDNPKFDDGAKLISSGSTGVNLVRYERSGFPTFQTQFMSGYFIPDYSGLWRFKIESDDAAFMWLGTDAFMNYLNNNQGAVIRLGGVHAAASSEYDVVLEKDKIYPIRIHYGNEVDVPIFKFDTMAPGFNVWQSDVTGLIWHTQPSNCSNWGIDFTTLVKAGYNVSKPQNECDAPTSTTTSVVSKKTTVTKPSFSLINIVGNKLNVSVNLGSAGTSKPDSVYLVAPKLGVLDSNKLFGKVSGSKASWSIDFDKLLSGTTIPLKVVGVKNGIESDPLEQDFNAPASIDKLITNKAAPLAPKNLKSRIVGTSAVISAEATIKAGALATQAYVFGPSIGLSKANAITGDIVGNKVLLEIPLKAAMAGKKLPVTIYLSNEIGDSQPVQTTIVVPSAPKIPSGSIKLPTQTKAPKTVFCVKGSQTRTFAASSCPPGWKNA